MPSLSVIIPNFNHSAFLRQRIDSVLQQTYQDFEIIILDDASTDNSWEILSGYRNHKKVSHCIRNERNSGSPFLQWKKGIELAKGYWIWIAESDDFADNTFLEKMFSGLQREVGLVYCRSYALEEGTLKDDCAPYGFNPSRWRSDYYSSGYEEVKNYLVYSNTIPNASACIFRRELAMFEDSLFRLTYCGDWYFWYKILMRSDLKYVSQPLNYFRLHRDSIRHSSNKERARGLIHENYYVINSIVKELKMSSLDVKKYKYLFDIYYGRLYPIKALFEKKIDLDIGMLDYKVFLLKEIIRQQWQLFFRRFTKLCNYFYSFRN